MALPISFYISIASVTGTNSTIRICFELKFEPFFSAVTKSETGTWDAGTWGRGTRGRGDVGT